MVDWKVVNLAVLTAVLTVEMMALSTVVMMVDRMAA